MKLVLDVFGPAISIVDNGTNLLLLRRVFSG